MGMRRFGSGELMRFVLTILFILTSFEAQARYGTDGNGQHDTSGFSGHPNYSETYALPVSAEQLKSLVESNQLSVVLVSGCLTCNPVSTAFNAASLKRQDLKFLYAKPDVFTEAIGKEPPAPIVLLVKNDKWMVLPSGASPTDILKQVSDLEKK